MIAEGNHLRYGLPLARDILERLRRGEQPTGRELADAMCIEQWRLVPGGVAPYLLAGTVAGLVLLFLVPPSVLAIAVAGVVAGGWRVPLAAIGAAGWAVMTLVFLPTVRLLGVRALWALSLPLGGLLYGAMAVDSAIRHTAGRPARW